MTTFLLIRHGHTEHTGHTLSGRLPGIALSPAGQREAARLPARLGDFVPDLLCTSPLQRCQETAAPLADSFRLESRVLPGLEELDYGRWTGSQPAELDGDPYWQLYNRHRSTYRIPAGELLVEAQLRMLQSLETLQAELPDGRIAVVGHCDPIRAILAYAMGLPLDFINRLSIAPASMSLLTLGPGEPRVHCINNTGTLLWR
ncbi:histidine phosphatase family protein [Gilvimarinus sp. F26214L]|uniref:histidine phosphatase family protein n=1 Tax=Gilvimarinus sp. DZF01 TaxID=3461371 RepID=UPI00404595B8